MAKIDATLNERGSRYGEYYRQAQISQSIKDALRAAPNWEELPPYMKEGFDMMANKMGRVLNGDWAYIDNWHDIVGYASLVEKELIDACGDLTNG